MVMDEKTRDLVAALLTIPVAERLLQSVSEVKAVEYESQQIVEIFFNVRKMVKKGYDEGFGK